MGTVIVNNMSIRQLFEEMLKCKTAIDKRKILIEAKSGKGKTSLLNYFTEQCEIHNIPCISFDFKVLDIKSELDFIEQIIFLLKMKNASLDFGRYEKCIEDYQTKGSRKIALQNVKIIQSEVGNITLPDNMFNSFITKATLAFWQDYNEILKEQKLVVLLDSFEQASETIRNWINRFVLLNSLRENNMYVIVAGQSEALFPTDFGHRDIEKFVLPDKYSIEEWYKYGEQIHIKDKKCIERCYKCYDGEPFTMCIALRPQGELDGT